VEGTMLTVMRELAEEAEARAAPELPVGDLLRALVGRGEDALARTPQYLQVLREAGVVDAGAAGLLELVRGLSAAVTGEPLPAERAAREEIGLDAVHRELSRFRYCTVFVVEGERVDAAALEAALEPLGDSLMVVGDESALKVHVHTDDPGAALTIGGAQGVLDGIEIANMHRQTEQRETRLLRLVAAPSATAVVAVVAGAGNAELFRSFGAAEIVDGGASMNPSTSDIVRAIESVDAAEVDAADMDAALAGVATGAVTTASRDVELNGFAVRAGMFLGLAEGDPVAGGADFAEVAGVVVERLLAGSRSLLTVLTGEGAPAVDGALRQIAARHPDVEVDVREGGQPHFHLLLSAE